MIQDAGSLDRLKDLAMPEAVSWWPMAAGWWVLFVLLLFACLFGALLLFMVWKKNSYRREAISQLQTAKTRIEINRILKRTALNVFPRAEIASLTGQQWLDWLSRTSSSGFENSEVSSLDVESFRAAAVNWVRQHPGKKVNRKC